MAKSPVLGAAFGLFSVWWGLSFVLYLASGRIWSGEEWIEASIQAWAGLVGGGLLGIGASAAVVLSARQWRIAKLAGDNVRGVVCSIGPLPVNFGRPVEAKQLPRAEGLRLPCPDFDLEGKIDREWMEKWFAKYEQDFPEHAALMRAVARVLNSKPELPAACRKLAKGVHRYQYGFDEHMHGNHTLVEHSWVCASVGIWLADHGYEYTGLQFQNREKQDVGYVPKKNKAYKFKAFDPLIGLICFAHDIGKIETFRMNEDGKVEVIEPAHDSVGARMLARMDEFWALPFEDRMTLTLAIGHYHKPSQIPLSRDRESPNKAEALSDRTMAMLRLVILADEGAGAIENKKSVLNGDNKPREILEEVYREDLWFAFKDLLSEAQRIHNEPSRYRIGQKNTAPNGALITLKEGDLRKALLEKMELRKSVKESTTASGSVQITEDLLEVLDEKGCLVKEAGGKTVAAKDAIWKVEFMGRDKTRAGEVIATWPFAILINPEEHFPRLVASADAHSMPRVVQVADRAKMAEEQKPKKLPGMNALTETPLVDADGVFIIPDGTKDKKNKGPKQPRSLAEGENRQPQTKPGALPAATKESSAALFLDDADPVDQTAEEASRPDRRSEINQTQANSAEGQPTHGRGATAVVGIVQQILQNKLNEATAINPVRSEAEHVASGAPEIPAEVMALAESMRPTLAKIDVAANSGRLAGDLLPDGRKGYSLDALSAVVPTMREKLHDTGFVRRLVAAGKIGAHVPVCITRKAGGNVMLLVVNEKALGKLKAKL